MRKIDKQNVLVVAAVVLCFMTTLGICYFAGGSGILSAINFGENEEKYYLLIGGAYEDISLARASAALICSRGGAGYVLTGDTHEVVLAVYASREDAEAVLNNGSSGGAYIKEVNVKRSELKWADKESRKTVENALEYFPLAFGVLYELSNGLNGKIVTIADAKTRVAVLRSQIEEKRSIFNSATRDKSASQYTEIKLALVTALALIDNIEYSTRLSSAETEAAAASSMRYQLVQLVLCRSALGDAL